MICKVCGSKDERSVESIIHSDKTVFRGLMHGELLTHYSSLTHLDYTLHCPLSNVQALQIQEYFDIAHPKHFGLARGY